MCDWREAVHCRNRAELLQALADETSDSEHREALRRAAQYYGKKAAAFEDKARSASQNETSD